MSSDLVLRNGVRVGRRWGAGALSLALVLALGGCPPMPTPGDNGNDNGGPGDDPQTPSQPAALGISSTQGTLQFNEQGFTSQFQRTAQLSAVLSNLGGATASVAWEIRPTSSNDTFLEFVQTEGQTASGTSVTITATSSPPAASGGVSQTVVATATLTEGGETVDTLRAEVSIRIVPDIQVLETETTLLEVDPVADPPVGFDENGQVTLSAAVTGAAEPLIAIDWTPLVDLPAANFTFPNGTSGEEIVLQVAGSPSGIFPFQVTVTDSRGTTTKGVVSVVLMNDVYLTVSPSQESVGTSEGFSLRTVRFGGEADFTYTFTVLDDAGNDVTDDTTITPESGTVDNDATNDWAVTGFAEQGTYRFFVTVSDARGGSFTASTDVLVGDFLTLAVEASRDQVGPSTAFTLRTRRNGGTPDFAYSFEVRDSSGANVTSSTMITHSAGDEATGVANTFNVSGFAASDTYRIFATISDSLGHSFTGSTEIFVGDDLTLDAKAGSNIVAPGGSTMLTFNQNGGVGPFTYTFSNAGSGGSGTPSFAPTSPAMGAGDLTVTWTAPAAGPTIDGSYRVDVTVTDALGNTAVDSVWLIVQATQALILDVRSNTNVIAPGDTATITMDQTGGAGPFDYVYSATGPGGAGSFTTGSPRNNQAGDITDVWTAPTGGSALGSYVVNVTVTDELGNSANDSVVIIVQPSSPITLDVRASTNIVAPGGMTTITMDQRGGDGPFDYVYSATGPGGAGSFLPASPQNNLAGDATSVWTAPSGGSAVGAYVINVTVTDDLGNAANDSVVVIVQPTSPLSLDVRADTYIVAPGGMVTVTMDQTGGVGPFDYVYSATGPGGAGSFLPASPQNNLAGDATSVWTAPSGGSAVGSYQIRVTVTDDSGQAVQDSIWVHVMPTIALSLDVTSSDYDIAGGDMITVTMNQTGGVGPFDYVYSATGPGGAGMFTTGSPQNNLAGDATDVWTAPMTDGSYRITVTVTDDAGASFQDSIWVLVQSSAPGQGITLDVFSDNEIYTLEPGDSTDLTFDVTGGTGPFDYVYTSTGPGGNTGTFTTGSPQNDLAGDATDTWTAPAAGGTVQGDYRITVTVTDDVGAVTQDTVWIRVEPAQPLSLAVDADTNVVAPGGMVVVTMDQTGGVGPFDYVYSATGPGGAGAFTTGSPQNDVAGDAMDTWTAPSGGSAVGSYVITVTATDELGNQFVDHVWVLVQPAVSLSLDLESDAYIVAPGGMATITMDQTGGVGPFDYVYAATGPGGMGAFTTGSPQNDVAGDAMDTWTAPSGGAAVGAYRITVTVTDDSGASTQDTVWIIVQPATPLSLDVRVSDHVIGTGEMITVTFDVTGGVGPYDYVYTALDPGGTPSGAFTTGSPQNDVVGDGTDVWTAPGAPASVTIQVTVTDDAGIVFVDSVNVEVQ